MRVEYFLCKASVSGEGKQELKFALRDFSQINFNTRGNAGRLIIEQFWLKVVDHLLVIGKELGTGFVQF